MEPALSPERAARGRFRNLFIRLDDAKFSKTDIHEALNTTLTLLRHEMEDRVRIDKKYGDIPEIRCYPAELKVESEVEKGSAFTIILPVDLNETTTIV